MSISPTLCTYFEVRKRKVGLFKFKAPKIISGVLKSKKLYKMKNKVWAPAGPAGGLRPQVGLQCPNLKL